MSSSENLVSYRRFISSFASKLDVGEANQIAYIRTGSTKKSEDGAFFLLLELERRNVFSFKNPSGLIEVARDVGREDLVLSVEEYVETHPRPMQQSSKRVKKKPVPIPSEERQQLENVHDSFVSKCVDFESEFHKTWKDTVTSEEGLKLLKKGQKIAQDLLSEMKIGENKLKGLSRPRSSSGSSTSSNDGSDSSTSPENSLSGLSSSPTRHTPAKQRSGPNRDKPIPIPRKPKTPPPYKRAVQESTRYASPLLGVPLSEETKAHDPDQPPPIPPKHSPSPVPRNPANSEMCRPTSSVSMLSMMKLYETAEEEEGDQTGDSGMGTGSGTTKYGTIEEWKEALQNPPPDTHEHRYQPIFPHSTDADEPYQELCYNN